MAQNYAPLTVLERQELQNQPNVPMIEEWAKVKDISNHPEVLQKIVDKVREDMVNDISSQIEYLESGPVISSAKWIRMNQITYKDSKGKERLWESVSRTTASSSKADAVAILAVLRRALHYDCIICVKQYRPPVRAYTIEFPAGLVDEGESYEEAALRELKEETGYTATCKHVSPATSLDAGLESSTLVTVTAEIDGNLPVNQHPRQNLEESESIEVIPIPVDELLDRFNAFSEAGLVVDSRVYYYAIALTQATKQKKLEVVDPIPS